MAIQTGKGVNMLFIGHFSFDEIDADGNQKHGYFSSLVDAESPDDAVSQFESRIRFMKTSAREMVNVINVYIEEILRIPKIPKSPIITRFQSSDGEFPPSVSHWLPGDQDTDVEAFGLASDVDNNETNEDGRFLESKPFITFDP